MAKLSNDAGKAGFTLIEVIVAIAILAIGMVIVMQLFSGSLRASRASCDYTRAIVHAKNKMEEFSIQPIQVWNESRSSGEFEDGFIWETEIQPYPEGAGLEGTSVKKLKVKVSWFNSPTRQKSVEIVSLKVYPGEDNETF